MFARHSRIALASVSFAALATFAAGCAVQTGEAGQAGQEEGASQSSEAMSYQPLGFARVAAQGSVITSFDSATATTQGVTVSHTASSGRYVVSFPAIATGYNGNAQIVAEGAGNERCHLVSWGPSSTTEQVTVQCHRPDGTAADSAFAVAYFRGIAPTNPSTWPTNYAHSWVSGGAVSPPYDLNSSGHPNTAVRTGTGAYTWTVTQASYANASIMVSAYGASDVICTVSGWGVSGTSTNVYVRCFNTAGAAMDSAFSASYALSGPIIDQQSAHTWFNGTSASPPYTAGMGKYECDAISVTGSAASNVASIRVSGDLGTWDTFAFRRASFVTAYGGTATYCKTSAISNVEGASSTSTSTIRCYKQDGTLTSPWFSFTQLTSDASGPC